MENPSITPSMDMVIPTMVFTTWLEAKKSGEKLLEAGNTVIDCLSDCIVKKYFSDQNGWDDGVRRSLTALETTDHDGKDEGEKFILYWRIEKDGKNICLPVVSYNNGSKITRYAVDPEGSVYTMGKDWGYWRGTRTASTDLLNETKEIPSNLLSKYGLYKDAGKCPKLLKVTFSDGNIFLPKKINSVSNLNFRLEKHTARSVVPYLVINALGLLEN